MKQHFTLLNHNFPEAYQLQSYSTSTREIYTGMIESLLSSPKGLSKENLVRSITGLRDVQYSEYGISRIISKYMKDLSNKGVINISSSFGTISIDDLCKESGLSKRDLSNYVNWLQGSRIIKMARGPTKERGQGEYSDKEIELILAIGKYRGEFRVIDSVRKAIGEVYSQKEVDNFNGFWSSQLKKWRENAKHKRTEKLMEVLTQRDLPKKITYNNWDLILNLYDPEKYKNILESDEDQNDISSVTLNAYEALKLKLTKMLTKEYSTQLDKYPYNLHFTIIGKSAGDKNSRKEALISSAIDQILPKLNAPDTFIEFYANVTSKTDLWISNFGERISSLYNDILKDIEKKALKSKKGTSKEIEILKGIAFVTARYINDDFPNTGAEIGRMATQVTKAYQKKLGNRSRGLDIVMDSPVSKEWARQLEMVILSKIRSGNPIENSVEYSY
jgi:hypothetical protein